MKRILLLYLVAITGFLNAAAQDTLYFETFNGATHSFTLNTTEVTSTSAALSPNDWEVNNVYTGGSGSLLCLGFPFSYAVTNTATQPSGITGNPSSRYLHVLSDEARADNIQNSNFVAADGICFNAHNIFARMTGDVSTQGYTNVSFKFWWICGGGTNIHGEVWYSTNSGTTWTQLTAPLSQYKNQTVWVQQTITNMAFDNQSSLRFGFRFVNNSSTTASDPGMSVDDLLIQGIGCAASTTNQNAAICQGESILLGGAQQTTAGTYRDTLQTGQGCDSIIVTALSVNPVFSFNNTVNICQGDSILLGGTFQTMAGTYQDTFQTILGCDSIRTTLLIIDPAYSLSSSATICQGDSIFLGGAFRNTTGTYTDVLQTNAGCDSIINTQLTVNPVFNTSRQAAICDGDSIFLAGAWQTSPGTYTSNFTTAEGCDSTEVTTLGVTIVDTSITRTGNTLIANATNATYQWIDCRSGQPVAGATAPSFSPTIDGQYGVLITQNGCTDTSRCEEVIIVGVNTPAPADWVRIGPNPLHNQLTIKTSARCQNLSITLFDLTGRQLTVYRGETSGESILDLSKFPAGWYSLHLESSCGQISRKLLKSGHD